MAIFSMDLSTERTWTTDIRIPIAAAIRDRHGGAQRTHRQGGSSQRPLSIARDRHQVLCFDIRG